MNSSNFSFDDAEHVRPLKYWSMSRKLIGAAQLWICGQVQWISVREPHLFSIFLWLR